MRWLSRDPGTLYLTDPDSPDTLLSIESGARRERRLWSLLELLRLNARAFLRLGTRMSGGGALYLWGPQNENKHWRDLVRNTIADLYSACSEMGLSVSSQMLQQHLEDIPRSSGEFRMLMKAVYAELSSRTLLYVKSDLAGYYNAGEMLSERCRVAFPQASREIVHAGNCLACEEWTASVFHSMRAAEIGVHALGHALCVTFPDKPFELAEWHNIWGLSP